MYSLFAGLIVGRNKKTIVIGSWGGKTFSDNSRFLYQFLYEHKTELGLLNVVWATRSKAINDKLNSNGYKSCLIGTPESKKWHLKAGIHIICNLYSDALNLKPDIDTKYSCGAKKIQLWHGAGIKACGYLTNDGKKISKWKKMLKNSLLFSFFSFGNWKNSFFVSISEENKRVAIEDYGYKSKKIILGSYPRLCYYPKLFDDEVDVIDSIKKMHSQGKVILFLPTFRKDNSKYLSPENIPGFYEWLKKNNYFWIKKKHAVDLNDCSKPDSNVSNILILNNIDVNIIIDYVDMVITDYSSVSTDAIYKNKITLEYCPDYDYYIKNDRGFVNDFSKYHVFKPVLDPSLLFNEIDCRINLDPKLIIKHIKTRMFLFGESQMSIMDLSKIIIGLSKKTKGEQQ